ncbi:fibrous sheath-interacting protein 1 isoform X3 [Ascaphus truei]|uniref:fibrous sheath-interacting protein 1 isoform X3 n=1 Tax=Ascaphus truei TaxID=8439 RepID=UPI003F59CB9B
MREPRRRPRCGMYIMKGSLDAISRPAVGSRSRPGSRVSSSLSEDKPKLSSVMGSLEVLSPELGLSQVASEQCWGRTSSITSSDAGWWSPLEYESEDSQEAITLPRCLGRSIMESKEDDRSERAESKETSQLSEEATDCMELQESGEEYKDPKLEKAIKKMNALDEILLKKLAKEKEVKIQGLQIRRQLWEELQCVTLHISARSHEESLNTNKFLALTPQLDETEDATSFEMGQIFFPVFPTQLPTEDEEHDVQEAMQGNISGTETRELLNQTERSNVRTTQRKSRSQRKEVDFIQRNIELAKDAGSYIVLMDDEKVRLEQLLGDIQDGSSDEDMTGDVSGWVVPGDGYTPEPGEHDQLAKIDADLQAVLCAKESFVSSYWDTSGLKQTFQEVSPTETGNVNTAPGERVLRYTKELREQKVRLKEIDQQLEDLEQGWPQGPPTGQVLSG